MSGYDDAGKAYVVEGAMERRGLTGPVFATQGEAKSFVDSVAQQEGIYSPKVLFIAPTSLPAHGLSSDIDAALSEVGTILVNAAKPPTALTLLHELAHSEVYRGGHGPEWQEQAAAFYGRHISAEAESVFRDLMGMERMKRVASQVPEYDIVKVSDNRLDHRVYAALPRSGAAPGGFTVMGRPALGYIKVRRYGRSGWAVADIKVADRYRRQGLGTALLHFAREDLGEWVSHRGPFSDDGLAFSRAVAKVGSTDYRMEHQPPTPSDDPEEGLTPDIAHLDTAISDAYEHPDWYGADREVVSALRAAKRNPEARVTIYRSVPPGLSDIETGNWVSLSRAYAAGHGEYQVHYTDDGTRYRIDWPVLSATVRAGDVYFGGNDLAEYGYWGPTVRADGGVSEDDLLRGLFPTEASRWGMQHRASGGTYFHGSRNTIPVGAELRSAAERDNDPWSWQGSTLSNKSHFVWMSGAPEWTTKWATGSKWNIYIVRPTGPVWYDTGSQADDVRYFTTGATVLAGPFTDPGHAALAAREDYGWRPESFPSGSLASPDDLWEEYGVQRQAARWGMQHDAFTETWDLRGGAPADFTDGGPVRVNGKEPDFLWRTMSAAEWENAQASGFMQSNNGGYTHAATFPEWRYHDGPTPGQRMVKFRYDASDGWESKYNLDGDVYAITRQPIPMDRVVAVSPPAVAKDFRERLGMRRSASTQTLYRGLSLGYSIAADELEAHLANPDRLVREALDTSRIGIHWTDDYTSAYNFATGRDGEGYVPEQVWDDDEPGWRVGVILEGEVDASSVLERGSQEHEDYAFTDAILDYGLEREVTVRGGSSVRVAKAEVIFYDSETYEEVSRTVSLGLTATAVQVSIVDRNTTTLTDGSIAYLVAQRGIVRGRFYGTTPDAEEGDFAIYAYADADEMQQMGWMEISERETPGQPRVEDLFIHEGYRRIGLATAMWEYAKWHIPNLAHSSDLSDEGRAWSKTVAKWGMRKVAARQVYLHGSIADGLPAGTILEPSSRGGAAKSPLPRGVYDNPPNPEDAGYGNFVWLSSHLSDKPYNGGRTYIVEPIGPVWKNKYSPLTYFTTEARVLAGPYNAHKQEGRDALMQAIDEMGATLGEPTSEVSAPYLELERWGMRTEAGSSWRPYAATTFWDDYPVLVYTDGGPSGRKTYDIYIEGRNVATRPTLRDAKNYVEDRIGPQDWNTVRLEKVTIDHYYWGLTDEFSSPTTVYVVKEPTGGMASFW